MIWATTRSSLQRNVCSRGTPRFNPFNGELSGMFQNENPSVGCHYSISQWISRRRSSDGTSERFEADVRADH